MRFSPMDWCGKLALVYEPDSEDEAVRQEVHARLEAQLEEHQEPIGFALVEVPQEASA